MVGQRILRVLIFAMLAGGASPVLSDVVVTYVTQGRAVFQVSAPDQWVVLTGSEVAPSDMPDGRRPAPRLISILPSVAEPETADDPRQVMWTGFWVPDGVPTIDEVPDYIAKVAPRLLTDVEVTFREEREVNGLPARVVAGVGLLEDRDIDWALAAIQIAPERVTLAAFIGEPAAHDLHQETLIGMLNSIEPAAGAQ